jgi:hypothetical protein
MADAENNQESSDYLFEQWDDESFEAMKNKTRP